MPGMMPGNMGNIGPQKDPIKDNMSMLNPTDLTMMAQEKKFSGDMSVKDVLTQLGIDVEGPAQQLFDFGKKQVQTANPMNKAKMAAQSMGKAPAPTPPQGQGEELGLDSLLK